MGALSTVVLALQTRATVRESRPLGGLTDANIDAFCQSSRTERDVPGRKYVCADLMDLFPPLVCNMILHH